MNDLVNEAKAACFLVGLAMYISFLAYAASYGWHKARAKFPDTIINTGSTDINIITKAGSDE